MIAYPRAAIAMGGLALLCAVVSAALDAYMPFAVNVLVFAVTWQSVTIALMLHADADPRADPRTEHAEHTEH